MEVVATQRYIRMSPRKLRLVVDMIRDLTPAEALSILPFVRKRAAGVVVKGIKNAIEQAKHKGFSEDSLRFKEIQVSDGPRLKRYRPVARGRVHTVFKRMSHLRIVLDSDTQKVRTAEVINKGRRKHGTKS